MAKNGFGPQGLLLRLYAYFRLNRLIFYLSIDKKVVAGFDMLSYVDVTFSLLDITFLPRVYSDSVIFSTNGMEHRFTHVSVLCGLVFVTLSETFNNYKQVKRKKVIKNVIVQ